MKKGWTEVALGDVFDIDLDAVGVDASASYPMVGVLSYGKGLFLRPPVAGSDTSYSTFYRLHSGQIVLSQLFGWEGAIAPVTNEFSGLFVSSQFPTFRPQKKLYPGFARWLIRNPSLWEQLKMSAKGMGDRRRTLSPEIFFNSTSILPPLSEQKRIASHLDAIEERLNRVRKLREESSYESLSLSRSLISEFHCRDINRVPMHQLVEWRTPDVVVKQSDTYSFAGVYSFGRGVFRKGNLSGMDFAYDRLTQLAAGDFTYPKLMAWEGALGIVPMDCDGCYVSPEFPVFRVDQTQVLPEVLDIHFKTPAIWQELASLSTGTNVRRRRLNPKAFLNYRFPLPSMKVQQELKLITERVAQKHKFETEIRKLEQALFPSLLDRIFNGS